MRFVESVQPAALPPLPKGEDAGVAVYHLSTPAHLAIFLEHYLTENPRVTASIQTHLREEELLGTEPVLGLLESEGRIAFHPAGSSGMGRAGLAIMLHSRGAAGSSAVARTVGVAYLLDGSREKYVIGGDGLVWRGSLGDRAARKLLGGLYRVGRGISRRLDRRAVTAGLRRLEKRARSADGRAGRILVARRPMLLWADAATGSLHRRPNLTREEERALYDGDNHGPRYFDHRRDWEGLLAEYQGRRWRNIVSVVGQAALSRGGRALDIGCGTGGLCDLLRRRGFGVTGIERSAAMIDICRTNFPEGIDFRAALVEKLAAEGLPFDFVTLSHVLEHIERPVRFLRSIRGLLKRDSVLYVETPLFVNDARVLRLRPDWIWQKDHYHEFSRAGLASVAVRAGLRVLKHGNSLKGPGHEPYQFLAAVPA